MHFEAEAKASGPCSRSILVVRFGILMACDNLDIASLFQVQFSSAWKSRDSQDILSESQKFSRWVVPKPPLLGGCWARPSLMTTFFWPDPDHIKWFRLVEHLKTKVYIIQVGKGLYVL